MGSGDRGQPLVQAVLRPAAGRHTVRKGMLAGSGLGLLAAR